MSAPGNATGAFDRGDDGWLRQGFGSLETHAAALRRARPDLGWSSAQLAAGSIEGSVVSCRSPTFAVTCSAVRGSFEMRGPASTEHLVLSLGLALSTAGLQWMHPVQAGMIGVYQPNTDVDVINRDDVSFAVIDISHAELMLEAERNGVVLDSSQIAETGVVEGAIPASRLRRLAGLVAMRHCGRPIATHRGRSRYRARTSRPSRWCRS